MKAPAKSLLPILLFASLLRGSPSAAQQQEGSASEGALFLLLPVGAEAVSLGRAMTAMEGSEAAFWNPAGLVGVPRSEIVIFRGDQLAGTATAISLLGAWPGRGTVGASYLLLDAGEQELTDNQGNSLGTISLRNHLGVVSGAARPFRNLSLGVSFKVIQFRFSCRGQCPEQGQGTSATTYAVDVGLQATPIERLRLGAMLAHVGPRLQVLNADQADPLPARARVAVAYDVVHLFTSREDFEGWLAVEVQDRLRDFGIPSLFFGTELTAGGADQLGLSLRAGYVVGDLLGKIEGSDPEDGARVGLGIRYDRLDMSIAKSLAVSTLTGETEPVHVTLSIGL